jgi:hypothetical protein
MFIKLIQEGYNWFSCRVLHNSQLTTPFETKPGARQGCLLSPLLFLVVLDKVLRASLDSKATGIHWKLTETLEDSDYAVVTTSAYFPTVKHTCKVSYYRVIHKSLRDFRTLQYNNQDRQQKGAYQQIEKLSKCVSYFTGAPYIHPW